MKPVLVFALVLGFVSGIAGCAGEQAKAFEVTTIQMNGIQCTMCVETIEKAVGNLDGVQKVNVDLDAKTTTVEYLPTKLTLAQIEDVIAGIGYDANQTRRNEGAYKSLPACCQ